jgi:hypothetical protein
MIAQVLNRSFVLEHANLILAELAKARPDDQRRGGEPVTTKDQRDEGAAELEAAIERENALTSGQRGFVPPAPDRRGDAPKPIDEQVFISHDPIISICQSKMEEYFFNNKLVTTNGAVAAGGRRDAEIETPLITDESLPEAPPPARGTDRRLGGRFSETDVGWISSLVAMGIAAFKKKRAFPLDPANHLPIADNARILMVGDWGSGLPRARKVADQMRKQLDDGKFKGLQQHVIHLGDVYYSGYKSEYDKRFLLYWPVRTDEADQITSWSLNGNHDMYSGGGDYFDHLLADPRFRLQQRSSFFSMGNKRWQILGLDSAFEDNTLADPQGAWVKTMLAGDKKSMLLSHHQLFSAYDGDSAGMKEKLKAVLGGPKPIDAWFWGHEHRCITYEPHMKVNNARLIGHGGVPVYMTHKKDEPYPEHVTYEYREFRKKLLGLEHFAIFGFAVLDFAGDKIQVRYIDEDGTTHHSEEIA